jgi:hypothetical protein
LPQLWSVTRKAGRTTLIVGDPACCGNFFQRDRVLTEPGLQIYQRKRIVKAIALLERARSYDERASQAYIRMGWHPGTETSRRHEKTMMNWDARADKAWNEAMAILHNFAGIPTVAPV